MNSGRAIPWKHSVATGLLTGQVAQLGLGAVLLLYVTSFFYWHSLERSPVLYDQSLYYLRSMAFYSQIRAGDYASALQGLQSGMALSIMPLRPVLVPLMTSLSYLVLGASPATAGLTTLFFSLLLLVLCYFVGKNWLGWQTGALGAFVVLTLPAVSILTRHYYLEAPLAAICALTVYLLLREDIFTSQLATTLLGLTVGLGMWIRETLPLFIIGPILGAALYSIYAAKGRRRLRVMMLLNLCYAAALAALVSLPFYFPKLQAGLSFLARVHSKEQGSLDIVDRLIAYYYMFAQLGVSLLFLLLFLACCLMAGLFVLLRRGGKQPRPGFWRGLAVIVPWIVVPLVLSPLSAAVDIRYIMPALPAFGMLTGAAIVGLRPRSLRTALTLLAVLAGLAQFSTLGFAGNSLRLNLFNSIGDVYGFYSTHLSSQVDIRKYGFQLDGLATPERNDWQRENVIYAIEKRRQAEGLPSAQVFVVPVTNETYYLQFVAESAFKDYPLSIFGTDGSSLGLLLETAAGSDYLIVKDGPPYGAPYGTPYGTQSEEILSAIRKWPFRPTSDNFQLPDGTHLVVYERNDK